VRNVGLRVERGFSIVAGRRYVIIAKQLFQPYIILYASMYNNLFMFIIYYIILVVISKTTKFVSLHNLMCTILWFLEFTSTQLSFEIVPRKLTSCDLDQTIILCILYYSNRSFLILTIRFQYVYNNRRNCYATRKKLTVLYYFLCFTLL